MSCPNRVYQADASMTLLSQPWSCFAVLAIGTDRMLNL